MGHRVTESGVQLIALLPATPEVFERHVHVKEVSPSDNPPKGF